MRCKMTLLVTHQLYRLLAVLAAVAGMLSGCGADLATPKDHARDVESTGDPISFEEASGIRVDSIASIEFASLDITDDESVVLPPALLTEFLGHLRRSKLQRVPSPKARIQGPEEFRFAGLQNEALLNVTAYVQGYYRTSKGEQYFRFVGRDPFDVIRDWANSMNDTSE
jgi:hypothetical protein